MKNSKVLVFGGTRYFGKRLVEHLLVDGFDVTVATRGNSEDAFGARVRRVKVDREKEEDVRKAAELERWDFVFDQICYSPADAIAACQAFEGRVGRYIHTSTQSVYLSNGNQKESDFGPHSHPIRMGGRTDFDYGEAKRLAEAVFTKHAAFPVAMLRLPIVLGPDDYTGRLEFHVNRVLSGEPIVLANLDSDASLISSEDAGRVLRWLADRAETGPMNASSRGTITGRSLLGMIEKATGKKANVVPQGKDGERSPIIGNVPRYLDSSLAESRGFQFSETKAWLADLIPEMVRRAR